VVASIETNFIVNQLKTGESLMIILFIVGVIMDYFNHIPCETIYKADVNGLSVKVNHYRFRFPVMINSTNGSDGLAYDVRLHLFVWDKNKMVL
jgi:hypothetical protein